MVGNLFLGQPINVEELRMEHFLAIDIRIMEYLILVVPIDSSSKLLYIELHVELALIV